MAPNICAAFAQAKPCAVRSGTGRRLGQRVLLALALSVSVAACAERPIDAALLATQFAIATTEEKDVAPVIRKWTQPLRLHLSGNATAIRKYRTSIEAHAAAYSQLIDLPVGLVDRRDNANVVIVFVRRFDFSATLRSLSGGRIATSSDQREEISRTVCITYRADHNKALHFAIMLIGTDNEPAILRECIPHELAHVLGTNHSNLIIPSIFSNQNYLLNLGAGSLFAPIVEPAWHDRIVLKTLYDKRLTPGMEAVEAGPIIKRILGEVFPALRP
ncbi:MAG: DUF2927 domain-containing protein [Proteobacteria bacterium]|nr:DUF2927 domain-containing protein [Pseudomonadota bacterium]